MQTLPPSAGSEAAAQRVGVAGQLLPKSPISRAQHKAPRATCFTHVIDALAAKPGFVAKPSMPRTAIASESRASLQQTIANAARLISSAQSGTSQPNATRSTSQGMVEGTSQPDNTRTSSDSSAEGTSQSIGSSTTSYSIPEGTAAQLTVRQSSCSGEAPAEVFHHRLQHSHSSDVTEESLLSESCLATASPSGSDSKPQSDAASGLDHPKWAAGLDKPVDTSGSRSSRPDAYRIASRPQTPETKHSKGIQQLWNHVALTPLSVSSPSAAVSMRSAQGHTKQPEVIAVSGSSCMDNSLPQEPQWEAADAATSPASACQAVSTESAAQDSGDAASFNMPSTDGKHPIGHAEMSGSSIR